MAPNSNQGNEGSLQSCLQSAPRALRAMTTSENPPEKDRDDTILQLLALRRQTKKDKEKARKRRRKLGMNETTAVAVAAAATVDESEGKSAAAAAARAASIREVAMAGTAAVAIAEPGPPRGEAAAGSSKRGSISQFALAGGAAATAAEPGEPKGEIATRAAGMTSIGQVVAVAGAGAAAAAAAVEEPGEARATSALGKGPETDSSDQVEVEAGVAVAEAVAPPSSPSLTTTTAGGDSANKHALARQRLKTLILPMAINFRQSNATKKVVTTQPAVARAAEAAEESAAEATAVAESKVHADERATAERACVEQAALKTLSTGILRAQAEEEASANNKVQPVLSLPPARKHAARPSKALTSTTAAEELQLPEARGLWTAHFQSSRGGLKKGDLHSLILEAVRGHPDLVELSPDELSLYVDTVLAIVFYRNSRCGVILPSDLRSSGFITELNAVGRMKTNLEESEYFSLARHEIIRAEFFRLCEGGWSVGHEALRWYRHYGYGSVVGAVRARRVIDAGLRPFPREQTTKGGMSGVGGYGHELEYGAWVCFFLCEEALRLRAWSERDVRYCFHLVDETGGERVEMAEVTRFFEDMQRNSIISGYSEDAYWPSIQEVISHHLDSMGVEKRRDDITLAEMTRSGFNVDRAGNFFEELFTGTAPPEHGHDNDCNDYGDSNNESTGWEEDGNSETTGEDKTFDSTGGKGDKQSEGMGDDKSFQSTREEESSESKGNGEEGQQCQPPSLPPPAAAAATAAPCPTPAQTVPTTVRYFQDIGGTCYPVQAQPLERQHAHQSWAPIEGNIARGYSVSPPPPPQPLPHAQPQAVAYEQNVEAACPIPSSAAMQQPQTAVLYLENIGGTCYPVLVPQIAQHAPAYAENVVDACSSPAVPYMQQHSSAYGQNFAGVCPMQAEYMQPQPLVYGEHIVGVCPMQAEYMNPQDLAYGEGDGGICFAPMGHTQPQPLPYEGMCPMPELWVPQHPPPMPHERYAYPPKMPQRQPFNTAHGANFAGGAYPLEMPQWQSNG